MRCVALPASLELVTPEVAPISGHRSVDLSGAAGGLGDYVSAVGSEPPRPYPQKRAVYRSSQVTAILLFDGAVVGSVHGGAPKPVAVATPPTLPALSTVSPPSRRRVWAHNIAAIASRSSYLGVHGVVLLLPVGLPVAVPALEECVAARTDGGKC